MQVFLWTAGVLFALMAIPAAFYFVLYVLRGDDLLQKRALKFYRWAALVFLLTFNIVVYGNIVIALLQLFGLMPYPDQDVPEAVDVGAAFAAPLFI
ncbi:MAG TPA: hypothetical protein VIW70_07810 [Rubrivivax sp.]